MERKMPWRGTHTDFRPDPDWPTLRLTNALDFPYIDRHKPSSSIMV
jgi:hypothetical protein